MTTAGQPASLRIVRHRQAVHVAQLSRDADLLRAQAASEPVQRQLDYARELSLRLPGSTVTIFVLSAQAAGGDGWQRDTLRVVPVEAKASAAIPLLRMLRTLHRATPISVITTQVPCDEGWLALVVGRLFGIPVIAQIHSDLFAARPRAASRERIRRAAHRWATRRMLAAFSAIRTVSSETRTRVARVARRVPLATIPVPVAMVAARTHPLKASRAKEPLVLFVGRLAPEKDLMAWLQVARLVSQQQPETRFIIVGDGPERARLEDAVARFGLASVVTFAGFITNSALPDLYARASAILLTSSSEGFARVLVEAASQGTPAVSTASAGPRDIVINGVTGFLHEPGDIAGLAHSVSMLVRQPLRATMMGSQARALVSVKFDPRRLRREWVDLWINTARRPGLSR